MDMKKISDDQGKIKSVIYTEISKQIGHVEISNDPFNNFISFLYSKLSEEDLFNAGIEDVEEYTFEFLKRKMFSRLKLNLVRSSKTPDNDFNVIEGETVKEKIQSLEKASKAYDKFENDFLFYEIVPELFHVNLNIWIETQKHPYIHESEGCSKEINVLLLDKRYYDIKDI